MATGPDTNPDNYPEQPSLGRLRKIVRQRDLPAVTGLQKTQIATEIRLGTFPKPLRLTEGGRAKGWLEDELIAWQAKRFAKREAGE
jgi:predicted DNA-binding transcriptional regulator AlpA